MTGDDFRDRFRRALRRKPQHHQQEQATGRTTQAEPSITDASRPQGVDDPRTKSSGHGQKTADKWNQ